MDSQTLKSLGVQVREIAQEYKRVISDGSYGSVSAGSVVTYTVRADTELDTQTAAVTEWQKAQAAGVIKPVLEAVAARESVSHSALVAAAPAPAPNAPPVAPPAAPIQAVELSIVTLDAPNCAHVFDQGEDRFKVFGGAWKKFGVSVYPEILAQYPQLAGWEAWPVCKIGKQGAEAENRYALPGGFQRAEVEVNAEGKPLRVHGFR